MNVCCPQRVFITLMLMSFASFRTQFAVCVSPRIHFTPSVFSYHSIYSSSAQLLLNSQNIYKFDSVWALHERAYHIVQYHINTYSHFCVNSLMECVMECVAFAKRFTTPFQPSSLWLLCYYAHSIFFFYMGHQGTDQQQHILCTLRLDSFKTNLEHPADSDSDIVNIVLLRREGGGVAHTHTHFMSNDAAPHLYAATHNKCAACVMCHAREFICWSWLIWGESETQAMRDDDYMMLSDDTRPKASSTASYIYI